LQQDEVEGRTISDIESWPRTQQMAQSEKDSGEAN